MNCQYHSHSFEAYCNRELGAEALREYEMHANQCSQCSAALSQHQDYLGLLRENEDDSLESWAAARLLRNATEQARERRQSRVQITAFLQGVAASFVVCCSVVLGYVYLQGSEPAWQDPLLAMSDSIPEASPLLSDVHVKIEVPTTIHGAKLAFHLPKGVRIQGYEGQTRVEWETDLVKGANELVLPLVVSGGVKLDASTNINAILEYKGQYKSFTLTLPVTSNG